MPSKNKGRGNTAEYHVRAVVESSGGVCDRAWGSDGRSMGLTDRDDGTIKKAKSEKVRRWQSKRFKWENVPVWFKKNCIEYLNDGIELVTFYVDGEGGRGRKREVYIIMRLEDYLDDG